MHSYDWRPIVLALWLAAAWTSGACNPPPDEGRTDTPCNACDGACEQTSVPITDASHTENPVDYPDSPPMGGPHDPCWKVWDVYDEEVETERWVHNLEHGGVVFLTNCPDGCEDETAALTNFVEEHVGTSLLTPYAAMEQPFAAVSWGHRLLLGCFDLDALIGFYDEHVDQAPESLPDDPPSHCPP